MPLTNPGTPFNEHGFGLVIQDIRKLFLLLEGSNDLNAGAESTSQSEQQVEVRLREVHVCVDGEEKTMQVMGTEPV